MNKKTYIKSRLKGFCPNVSEGRFEKKNIFIIFLSKLTFCQNYKIDYNPIVFILCCIFYHACHSSNIPSFIRKSQLDTVNKYILN